MKSTPCRKGYHRLCDGKLYLGGTRGICSCSCHKPGTCHSMSKSVHTARKLWKGAFLEHKHLLVALVLLGSLIASTTVFFLKLQLKSDLVVEYRFHRKPMNPMIQILTYGSDPQSSPMFLVSKTDGTWLYKGRIELEWGHYQVSIFEVLSEPYVYNINGVILVLPPDLVQVFHIWIDFPSISHLVVLT